MQRERQLMLQKNTPCKESLALPRPNLANSTSKCPSSTCHAIPLSLAAEDDSSDGDPPRIMPNHIVGTNDNIDGFRDRITGDEPMPSDLMDEEYYMFHDQGMVHYEL